MAPSILYLRPADSIVLPSSQDSIFILSVQAILQASGKFDVVVEGLSNGSSSCDVTLISRAGPLSDTPALNASGFFTSSFGAVSVSGGDFLAFEAVNTDSGSTGKDGLLLTFPIQEKLDLPEGKQSVVDAKRFDYLAGLPDRIVNTRYFNQLVLEPRIFFRNPNKKKVIYGRQEKDLRVKDLEKLFADGKKEIELIWKKFADGIIRYPQYLFEARAALKKIDKQITRKADANEKKNWSTRFLKGSKGGAPKIAKKKGRHGPSLVQETAGSTIYIGYVDLGKFVPADRPSAELEEWLDYMMAADDFGGKVGLLFADRLRFQPAGIVVGEPIYTMSLAPEEEVELRQVVETKRKSTIDNIIDREQELSLNLTASWTNEITEGLSEQSSVQNAVHVGANADLKLPIEELPIGFGVNVSNDVTTADTITREHSTNTTFERTSSAASKMRSQHKIRMEVTNEIGNTLATTRKIRNANTQRSQTHIFSKIYRKERVTLERHDLQLCFRLVVNDPSFNARQNFLANLDKFDPNNPDHYSEAPKAVTGQKTLTVHYGDTPAESDFATYSTSLKDVDLRSGMSVAGGGSIPAAHILSSAKLHLVDYEIEEYTWNIVNGIENYDLRTETGKNSFEADGGSFSWRKEPPYGGTTASGNLAVKLSLTESRLVVYEYHKQMTQARIRVTAEWVPTQADLDAVRQSNAQTRNALVAACTEDRIKQIRDFAVADYPGQALASAFSWHLEDTPDMVHLRHIFDFENSIVESAPYWASNSGIAIYRSLEERLLELPIPLAINSILTPELTSPQAIVYIPIFHGHESEALDLLPGVSFPEKQRILDDINGYRNARFANIPTVLPKYDEVLGPKALSGTPSGDSAWATAWEKPQKKFDVIAHWQLLTPTDGVHMETRLSESVATDEHRTRMLENQTGD